MKSLWLVMVCTFLIFNSGMASSNITNYIKNGELVIYFPSFNEMIDSVKSLMERFFGANYASTLKKAKLITESDYGVNIFEDESLMEIGIDPDSAFSYVHMSSNTGYLIFSLLSAYDFEQFVMDTYDESLSYKILDDDFVVISENLSELSNFDPELVTNKAFKLTKKKLGFEWDKPFLWMSGDYIPEMLEGVEDYNWDELPYSFFGAVAEIKTNGIDVDAYSGVYQPSQLSKIKNIQIIITERSYQALDYIEGNPILLTRFCINHNSFFKYFRNLDVWDITGFQSLDEQLLDMGVDLDSYLIDIADGRINLVIDSIDSDSGDIDLYGSMGILFTNVANTLFTTMKSPLTKWGGTLDTFEIFAHEFYQYDINDLTIYYGIIADDIIFSTDKDHLETLVGNIYANKPGFLQNTPDFFSDAVQDDVAGLFMILDVQSFLSQLSDIGIDLKSEFLIGIENIWVQSTPDTGYDAYGWNTSLKINFY